jgi:hypothetical protein
MLSWTDHGRVSDAHICVEIGSQIQETVVVRSYSNILSLSIPKESFSSFTWLQMAGKRYGFVNVVELSRIGKRNGNYSPDGLVILQLFGQW